MNIILRKLQVICKLLLIAMVLLVPANHTRAENKSPLTSGKLQEESVISSTATIQGVPFGLNNPFASSQEKTSDYVKNLGVTWISDHFPRREIEKEKRGIITYDFSEVDEKLKEYGTESNSQAWFIINIESKYRFGDGKEIGNAKKAKGKFVPAGPNSYKAYEEFLIALVTHVNRWVPGWRVKLWSIDNEESGLYLPAFCGDGAMNNKCVTQAAEAYAEIVTRSNKIIKPVDAKAKIVFGGPGGGTPDEEYIFYDKALRILRSRRSDGYFDFFDYHNFNVFQEYKTNPRGKDIDFFKKMLEGAGFSQKPIIIKAGATHSGVDHIAKNKRLHAPQTEREQAEYLFKRFLYHVGNGVKLILWGDVREDEELHGTYSHNGLMYNGIPAAKTCDPTQETPCPDPGDGIRKLSYYTFQFMMEKLKNSEWQKPETLPTGEKNIYLYKLPQIGSISPIFVAWFDYWMDSVQGKRVTLSVETDGQYVITEAIPSSESGAKVEAGQYRSFFKTSVVSSQDGKIIIALGKIPIFIERSR